ncbi:Uncharacterised protein [Actinomyces bovis]|uniref:Bacterial SCP orthologue domain-containing protein n=1 Tax=Actinomyces bovis TaxID=1658 RepID=A0ABY1VNY8_9ACTO|nr:sterol carrier family protein [Actinomyces bovis]SPT53528.1 Uncharacterised protein [Actinomyces bovis]VEG55477.1 Uncharacterised protein [Actinomyces israelii]
MAARRRIDLAEGAQAVRAWAAATNSGAAPGSGANPATTPALTSGDDAVGPTPAPAAAPNRATIATAVRFTLEELAACAPGRSVEVRVPPYGVTQAVSGTVHRRGTPPSVVETDAETWLALATGRLTWAEARDSGALEASGERCDLSAYLPLLPA